jgi:hypothetical protein
MTTKKVCVAVGVGAGMARHSIVAFAKRATQWRYSMTLSRCN